MTRDADKVILLLLKLALFRHVSVRAEPPDDFTRPVPDRYRSGKKPAILPVLGPQRKGVLPGLSALETRANLVDDTLDVIGMMHFLPAPACHVFQGRPSVLVPPLVVPENGASLIRHPRELRNIIGKRTEPLFVFPRPLARPHQLSHVNRVYQNAAHFIVIIHRRLAGEVEIAVLQLPVSISIQFEQQLRAFKGFAAPIYLIQYSIDALAFQLGQRLANRPA